MEQGVSFDCTNSDVFDNLPVVTQQTSEFRRGRFKRKKKKKNRNPPPRTIGTQTQQSNPRTTSPQSEPRTVAPPITPTISSSADGDDAKPKAKPEEVKVVAPKVDEKPIWKEFWVWGILVGGVAGFVLAKTQKKNLIAFALIGGAAGGGAGFGIQKFKNK